MSPVDFNAHGRHYQGRTLGQAAWICKACGTSHTTAMEAGCPQCGNATPAQAEAATKRPKFEIPKERILQEVLSADWDVPMLAGEIVTLGALTEKARITAAVALAHYADHGEPSNEQLPRAVIAAWARLIANTIITDEQTPQSEEK